MTPGFEGFLPGFFPFDGFFFLPDNDGGGYNDEGNGDCDSDEWDKDDGDFDDYPLRQPVRAAHRLAPVTTASW